MQLTINVPDDSSLAEQVGAWADGMSYELKVKQTGPGAFDLLEAEDAEEGGGEQNNEGDEPAPDKSGKNPAMVVMIGKMRGGKSEKMGE